jgi:hypothetical protein
MRLFAIGAAMAGLALALGCGGSGETTKATGQGAGDAGGSSSAGGGGGSSGTSQPICQFLGTCTAEQGCTKYIAYANDQIGEQWVALFQQQCAQSNGTFSPQHCSAGGAGCCTLGPPTSSGGGGAYISSLCVYDPTVTAASEQQNCVFMGGIYSQPDEDVWKALDSCAL